MTSSLSIYKGFSQNNRQQLDEGRRNLKDDLNTLLNNEEAEPDLVSRCHSLLNQYPDLAELKAQIRYPEEIAISDITSLIQKLEDAGRKFSEMKADLLQLSDYYRNFVQKFTNSPKEIQAVLLSPKARIQGDLFDEPYRVTQDVARKLLSRNRFGDVIKQNASGNHPVVALGGVHLKSATEDEPLDTGMEISVYLLHTLLFGESIGPGLAPSSLLTLENVEIEEPSTSIKASDVDHFEVASKTNRRGSFFRRHPEYPVSPKPQTYLLQASKTINGQRLDQVLDDPNQKPTVWDNDNFSSLILASFLTIPSDNKPDNFMVTTGETVAKIIGIDNDMAFAYPFTAYGQKKEHMIGFKNALLCFDDMMDKRISPKVRERIATLDPILLGIEWAAAVLQQEQRLPTQKSNQCQLPLRFTKHTLQNLIENLIALQKVLSDPYFERVTHRQLFRLLFPVVERYYRVLSKDTTSTIDRIDNLFSNALPPVERYLKQEEKLEDGQTIKEALAPSEKRALAYQEERDTSIEELCYEVLRKIDLAQFPPAKLTALLSLAACHFPKLVTKELHPSWRSEALPFSLIYEQGNLHILSFLEKLGVDFKGQNNDGDTLVHLLLKQGLDLPKEFLQKTKGTDEFLEIRNSKGTTPLDIAMEQGLVSAFIALIYAGAGTSASSTNAWMFYKDVVKKKNDPHLTEAFQRLIKRNQGISWKMAKETIFPSEIKDGIVAISALSGKKGLHSDAAKQLWKSDGAFIAVNTTGKRAVGKATVDGFTLYFKQAPELSGIEQAVGTLMHQLMGFGAPHTDLVKIKGVPYLVSQEIQGQTMQETLEKNPTHLQKLDKKRLSQLLLMTMLINPEDGKPDNYIIEPISTGGFQIVSIDNDHAFVPSVAKEKLFGNKQNRVQVKTILYCLDQMKDPIDPSVREQFLKHDPAEILIQWLGHLSSIQGLYNDIYSESERKNLFKDHGVFVGIPLRAEMVTDLYRKMVKMQFLLDQEKDNQKLSHIDLLMKLDPALGQRYQGGSNKVTPMQRFLAIDGKDYDIKNATLISTRQAREILNSYNITTKTDMQALITSGIALDADEALKKLHDVVNKDQKDLAQRLLLAEGGNVDFASLSADQVADILKKIDFSKLPIPVQQSILGQIRKFAFKSLHLRNASMVTNAYLKGLDFSQLITLELPGCQSLTDQVVEQILGQAPELQKLNLSGINSFEKIYGVQGIRREPVPLDLKKITHLILNSCPKLHTLIIKSDQLVAVECEGDNIANLDIQSASLTYLNVKGNKLLTDKTLDLLIEKCRNLERLKLDDCDQITDNKLKMALPRFNLSKFSSEFKKTLTLILLNIIKESHFYFNDYDEARMLAEILKTNTSLTKLDLSLYSTHHYKGGQVIAEALKFNNSLNELSLRGNDIGNVGAKVVAEALMSNKSITKLDLCSNRIGAEGAKAIADALMLNNTLTELNLGSNEIGIEGAKAIAEALKFNRSITKLNLGRNEKTAVGSNKIGYEGAKAIADALMLNKTLAELDLGSNNIGPEGAKAISIVLGNNSSLSRLDLSNNEIKDEGAKAIAASFKSNTSLAIFGLCFNSIGDEGAKAIAEALKLNKSPPELKLRGNCISYEGAKAIGEALKFNTSLIKLGLQYNYMSTKGIKSIAEALKTNTFLAELDLTCEDVEGQIAIADALKSNTSLARLDISEMVSNNHSDLYESRFRENGFNGKGGMFGRWERKVASSEKSSSASAAPTPSKHNKNKPITLTQPISVNPIEINYEDTSAQIITPDALYSQGNVLEKTDLPEAIDRYLEATKQKHVKALKKLEEFSKSSLHAQYALGCYFEQEENLSQAAFYYAMATSGTHLQAKQALYRLAEKDPEAQSQLAILMERGLGVRENIEQALILHKKAADKGVGLSKLHLGILYHMGFSTDANRELALSLISQAENQGVPQAGKTKTQIQKEKQERVDIIQRAKDYDRQLYLLANKKSQGDLLSQLSLFDKTALPESHVKRMKAQGEAFERQKADLLERIADLEAQKKTASSENREGLKNEIERLEADLKNLDKTQKVYSDPVEEARQYFLNKKRELFYSGFKGKIEEKFQAVNAIVSGEASRNTSMIDQGAKTVVRGIAKIAGSAIPGLSIAVDGAISAGEALRDRQAKKQCSKIQGYYPVKGAEGVVQFSSLLAGGIVYRFQDQIPHLDEESIERLIKHFAIGFSDYLYEKSPEDASAYELIIGGTFHKFNGLKGFSPENPMQAYYDIKDIMQKKPLRTNYGFEVPIDDLIFSTGVRTPYGGKYLPKDLKRQAFLNEMEKKSKELQKEFPVYRLGTKEEIEMLANMGIEMECVEEERIGALATTIHRKKAAARYMQEAESLAQQFLTA